MDSSQLLPVPEQQQEQEHLDCESHGWEGAPLAGTTTVELPPFDDEPEMVPVEYVQEEPVGPPAPSSPIPIPGQSEPTVEVSCLKCCRQKPPAQGKCSDGKVIRTRIGRRMLKGTCDNCGSNVTRLLPSLSV